MSQLPAPEPPLGAIVTHRQKMLIMGSLVLCMFISALDSSILATATPNILADLGGFSLLSWVFTVYLLTSTVVIPVAGKLSDMFGRKVFLLAGIAIFVGSSAAAGAAPSMMFLIGARAVQGVGGGIVMASVFASLGDLLTPIERAKYFAFFAGAGTIASVSGPTVGGFLTDGPGWRWCFYINLPIGALAATAIAINLPMRRTGGRLGSIDFLGAALLAGATTSLLLGLVWSHRQYGWSSPQTIGLFAAAAALTVALVLQERRHPQAMLPLYLFRNRVFVTSNLLSVAMSLGMAGAITYLPTFIQTSLGASATSSGIVSTPQSLAMLGTSIFAGQAIARTGRWKVQLVAGGVFMLIASMLMQTLDVGVAKWHISVFVVIYGIGSGFIIPTMSVVIQSCVQPQFMGVASSSRIFFMQIGTVIGAAVFGVILASSYESAFSNGIARKQDLPPGAYQQMLDPTLALNTTEFERVRQEVLLVPGGQALLDDALRAQKAGMAVAIRRVFLGSTIAAAVVIVLALVTTEIPLRRTHAPSAGPPAGAPIPAPAGALADARTIAVDPVAPARPGSEGRTPG